MADNRYFPPRGSPESELLAFRDRQINRWSVVRNERMAQVALSYWYAIGQQWAKVDREVIFDGTRGAILASIDNDEIPQPVTNRISPALEQEMISLVKRKWVPKVIPTDKDPRIKAAAQVAQDSLSYFLDQVDWPNKRHQYAFNFACGGTGILYTGWDKSYFDLKPIGAPSAVYCEGCDTKLYSSRVPADLATGRGMRLETATPVPIEDSDLDESPMQMPKEMLDLHHCPTCGMGELKPYSPNQEEIESEASDVFGRPLSVLEPRGTRVLEVDLPFELYPQDAGIRVSPDTLKRWGRRKIRSLEWVEERAPHLVNLIHPDSISDLLYDDPFFGGWSVLGSWSSSLDAGILDNNVNVDEIVEQPSFRNPRGRYVMATKDVVIEDSDLLEEGTAEGKEIYVPRVQISIARYKIRPNTIWGTSLPEEVISPQNRLNGMDSQIIETRTRMGSPNMLMTPGMWVDQGPAEDAPGGGKYVWFQIDPEHPELTKPEPWGGTLFPTDIYQERDRVLVDIKDIIGPGDVAGGQAPKNVGTTSGLELLIQQDEYGRSLREDSFVGAAEKSWSHALQLQWILRVDPDEYRVLGPDNTWKYEQYIGAALRGQTEVKVERGPYIAKSVLTREAHREALADRIISADSPVSRRKLREAYGIAADVNEDSDNQVDQAERQWVDFVDKGIVRAQDTIDDPAIRYAVFSTSLLTEEGQNLTSRAGWDEIRRIIASWEDEFQRTLQLEAMSIQFYGGRLVGDEAAEAYAKAQVAYFDQKQVYAQQAALAQQVSQAMPGSPAPASPPPPQPPPPPVQLPTLLQDRIFFIWQSMLTKAGWQGTDPSIDPFQSTYIKFRALVEAYKMSMSPMTSMPPPGAPEAQAQAAPQTAPVGATTPTAPLPGGGQR